MRVKELINFLKTKLGPYEEFDKENNGLLFGDEQNNINEIYFCWRLTLDILKKINPHKNVLVVCHEPVIYHIKPIFTLHFDDDLISSNKKISEWILSSKVNIARFHLSLDSSVHGTGATLIKEFKFKEIKRFNYFSICEINGEIARHLINKIKKILNSPFIEVVGDVNRKIKKILIVAGGGANKEFLSFALTNNCDAIISGDSHMESKYFAYENEILLIDPGHQYLEVPGVKNFAEIVRKSVSSKKIKVNFIPNEQIEEIF